MAELKIHTLPPRAGLQWLRTGLRLFLRQPLLIFLLAALGPFVFLLTLALVPVLGQAACLLLTPVIAVGMLSVCRTVDAGGLPGLSSYTAALLVPSARLQLLKVGVYYALVAGLLATAWSLMPAPPAPPAAPGTVAGASPGGAPTASLAMTPLRALALAASLCIWLPLQMTIWFSPVLCAWHGMPAGKALFFSFFACWRNRAPMLVFLLALIGTFFAAMVLFAALAAALGAGEPAIEYLLAPVPLLLLAIAQASNLGIYRAVVDDGSTA
jgi:hypothetical protein